MKKIFNKKHKSLILFLIFTLVIYFMGGLYLLLRNDDGYFRLLNTHNRPIKENITFSRINADGCLGGDEIFSIPKKSIEFQDWYVSDRDIVNGMKIYFSNPASQLSYLKIKIKFPLMEIHNGFVNIQLFKNENQYRSFNIFLVRGTHDYIFPVGKGTSSMRFASYRSEIDQFQKISVIEAEFIPNSLCQYIKYSVSESSPLLICYSLYFIIIMVVIIFYIAKANLKIIHYILVAFFIFTFCLFGTEIAKENVHPDETQFSQTGTNNILLLKSNNFKIFSQSYRQQYNASLFWGGYVQRVIPILGPIVYGTLPYIYGYRPIGYYPETINEPWEQYFHYWWNAMNDPKLKRIMRTPSVFLISLSTFVIFLIGFKLSGCRFGAISALFWIFHPLSLQSGRTALTDIPSLFCGLILTFSVISFLNYFRNSKSNRISSYLIYIFIIGVCISLMIAVKFNCIPLLIVLFSIFIFSIIVQDKKRRFCCMKIISISLLIFLLFAILGVYFSCPWFQNIFSRPEWQQVAKLYRESFGSPNLFSNLMQKFLDSVHLLIFPYKNFTFLGNSLIIRKIGIAQIGSPDSYFISYTNPATLIFWWVGFFYIIFSIVNPEKWGKMVFSRIFQDKIHKNPYAFIFLYFVGLFLVVTALKPVNCVRYHHFIIPGLCLVSASGVEYLLSIDNSLRKVQYSLAIIVLLLNYITIIQFKNIYTFKGLQHYFLDQPLLSSIIIITCLAMIFPKLWSSLRSKSKLKME